MVERFGRCILRSGNDGFRYTFMSVPLFSSENQEGKGKYVQFTISDDGRLGQFVCTNERPPSLGGQESYMEGSIELSSDVLHDFEVDGLPFVLSLDISNNKCYVTCIHK